MGNEKKIPVEQHPDDGSLKTRRIRGLSQRLRDPLSLKANLPPTAIPSRAEAEVEAEAVPAGEPPNLNASPQPLLGTRRIVRRPAAKIPQEGLLSVGAQLQDRYKILGVIGVGGMGAVYKAQDLRFPNVQRLCAVKEMVNTTTDPQVRKIILRNFDREASILATLSHPAIPQVYDYFTAGRRSYLVLEYIHGQDLEAILTGAQGFFSETQVVTWATQLCDVLFFLHNHKPRPIIFRDLKPSNIMLDEQGRIRLVDFGIAKLFQSGTKGTMIGTEGYSPPEQYRGVAEPRGDIYALGATMHHLLSKQDPRLEPPFSFHERPIHKTNPTVSPELMKILDKSLEYDINKRWGSAEEFKRALLSLPSARGLGGSGARMETAAFIDGSVKPIWRFACEDEVRVAVGVGDDRLYVPSYDNNVYALELETGKLVWKYPTEGSVATTPWVGEDVVIFGSTDAVVYAVEARLGRLAWTVPTQGKIYSSPFGDFGHVFIGSDDHHLYAIHLGGGRISWTYQADGALRTRPLFHDNMILFACQAGIVYALGLDREMRWRFRARRGFLSSPVADKGLVFIGSLDWNFYALDIRSGWAAWRYRAGGPIVSTPAVWEGLVFFGSADGYIYALDAGAGRVVWRHQVEGQVTASPTGHGGSVYIGGVDGQLYCLDARTGDLRWQYRADGPITAAPVVVGGVVYCGSLDHYVYAIPA
ncbi:MAG: PQQ-binding-like beta-propeller repeat protein [Anaerolineae bacterium]|nr:PQQ-binding-like beta-propeller repeat protein [Anaerolineae bacterium]